MCKFLSGITLENGDVCISKDTDSHSEILKEFGIKDKDIPPSFVAWEFTPPIKGEKYDFAAGYDKWTFNIDEQFPKPEWWDKGREVLTVEAARAELDKVLIKTRIEEIKTGRWIIINGGYVNILSGGTVNDISGGTVNDISGGTVNYISGGTVNDIRGGTVNYISGGTVKTLDGSATVTIYTDYTKYRITPTENAVVIHRSNEGVKIITAKKKAKKPKSKNQ